MKLMDATDPQSQQNVVSTEDRVTQPIWSLSGQGPSPRLWRQADSNPPYMCMIITQSRVRPM